MNTMKLCITCLILTFCFPASPVRAEVPRTISYQGSLKQTDGTPVDGTVSMSFALYDSLSGGSALWSETQSVSVSNGIYSVVLGTASPLDLLFNVPYYLEVTVDGTALTPRQELTSVPYALGISGLSISDGKVGIGQPHPQAVLDVGGAMRLSAQKTLLYQGITESGPPIYDGFRLRHDNDFFGENQDAIVFEKTDGNDSNPDGGIAFVNTGHDSLVEPVLVIRGNGNVGIGTTDPQDFLEVAGTIKLGNYLKFDENSLVEKLIMGGSSNAGMCLFPNTSAWNSQAWISMRGDDGSNRVGELGLAGTYIDFRYGSTTEAWGNIGMRLASSGHLGIGRTDPSYNVDIAGNMRLTNDTGTNQGIGEMRFSGSVLSLNADGGTAMNYPYIEWRRNGSRGAYLGWGSHGNYFQLNVESNNDLALTGGNVGIGTTTPQYALDVSGNIRGSNVSPSDRRWKTEIAPLKQALQHVTRLQGVSFRWKDAARGEGQQLGLIAQDVETVFPEVVSTDSEGYKSVAYDKLTAPLIEAVKALKAENDALTARNDDLERRIEALEALVNQKQ